MHKYIKEKYVILNLQITDENEIILQDENSIKNASAILSLLHGKADSNCRIFKKPILVDIDGLQNLHQNILSKLELHQVGDVVTSVNVSFSNRHLLAFKSWNDFCTYNYGSENSKIQSIVLQWDFFIKLDHYELPQRHTLNVRIASTPKPSDIFKVLLSGGFDEEHDIDIQGSTMLARVDFINSTLAEELLNIVAKWNELCETPNSIQGGFRKFLFLQKTLIANITEFFILLTLVSTSGIVLKLCDFAKVFSISTVNFVYLVLALIPLSELFKDISRHFAKKLYRKLDNIIDVHVFNISKGDVKTILNIEKSTNYTKEVLLFILNVLVSIILSIIFFLIEK